MSEKEPQDKLPKFAFAVPVDEVVDSAGSRHIHLTTVGTDQETVNEMVEEMKKELPGELREAPESCRKLSSTFGFSSSYWKSPWNPTGPKKNWGPPKNPSLN